MIPVVDVRFEVGGRKVSSAGFANAIERAIYQQVRDSVVTALRGVTCPEHGQSPAVVVKGRSMDNLAFEVSGCCQDLIDRSLRKLR